ncbi:hypothetical protein [Lactococcus kimchii]|uniref:hypothetical protein n=1 Tax=Lactococcus sp. S-13 TaxID=2507158 RepID=UPI0010231047|nr:hypothetical protein [Lactococcus sp. S-13]RZI49629.1 hypothetical protein EQJ87_09445 [Lactococcus sp. S-13]
MSKIFISENKELDLFIDSENKSFYITNHDEKREINDRRYQNIGAVVGALVVVVISVLELIFAVFQRITVGKLLIFFALGGAVYLITNIILKKIFLYDGRRVGAGVKLIKNLKKEEQMQIRKIIKKQYKYALFVVLVSCVILIATLVSFVITSSTIWLLLANVCLYSMIFLHYYKFGVLKKVYKISIQSKK